MDINYLFEERMKTINQYADEIVAERMQLQLSQIGRTPEADRLTIISDAGSISKNGIEYRLNRMKISLVVVSSLNH